MTLSTVTVDEQVAWIERDIVMRRSAYPKMIEGGHLRPETAERDLLVLATIQAMLRVAQANGGKLPKGSKKGKGKPVVIYFPNETVRADFLAMMAEVGMGELTMQVPQ